MAADDKVMSAALRVSAYGTKRTYQSCRSMSAFGGKADISQGVREGGRNPSPPQSESVQCVKLPKYPPPTNRPTTDKPRSGPYALS
jgi:hypothetical protein